MKINPILTNSYRSISSGGSKKTVQNPATSLEVKNGHMSLKRQLKEAGSAPNKPALGDYNKFLKSSMSYGEQLRAQREKIKNASLEKKKLKYAFKDISSQIVSSKTSLSARKAAGQAKREIMRLQKEKATGKYDPEEIEAAIAHAKAMERVARKKVKHLEQEEMAKAAAGPLVDLEEREDDGREEFNIEDLKADSEENTVETASTEDVTRELLGILNEAGESLEEMGESLQSMLDEMSDSLSAMGESLQSMLDEMSDSLGEMNESLQDMLDEMGFGELTESVKTMGKDCDPEDLKMMKIKHRCKEMKEIAKADSEYLKAVFEQLAKAKDAGAGAIFGGSGSGGTASGAMQGLPSTIGNAAPADIALGGAFTAGAFTTGAEVSAPVIDISL